MTNLEVREEVVARLARHVDDVVVLHGLLVHLAGLSHHHRGVHVHRVGRVLHTNERRKREDAKLTEEKQKICKYLYENVYSGVYAKRHKQQDFSRLRYRIANKKKHWQKTAGLCYSM